jgi:lysine 2,3-aminomutase
LSRNEEGNMVTLPFIDSVEELSKYLSLEKSAAADIIRASKTYPFRISEHYLSLVRKHAPLSCAVGRQAIPSVEELVDDGALDPLNEKAGLVTPAFIERYPGRGVFLVSAECAMYCRFCNRRRLVGKGWDPAPFREETLDYLEQRKEIREVIISGGDPLMLPPQELSYILSRLKRMGKTIIRISTRLPVVSPERVTEAFFQLIGNNAPLWIVIHINHPDEISPEFIAVVRRLMRSGAALVSQTVLLRGVNDCPHVLGRLFEELVSNGVKPYYLFQLDEVRGSNHFKVRLDKGIEIMRTLRKTVSGLAMPCYALDIPGGRGKIPVDHRYMRGRRHGVVRIESPLGGFGIYDDNGAESRCTDCNVCSLAEPEIQKSKPSFPPKESL